MPCFFHISKCFEGGRVWLYICQSLVVAFLASDQIQTNHETAAIETLAISTVASPRRYSHATLDRIGRNQQPSLASPKFQLTTFAPWSMFRSKLNKVW
jgi:hypothetical protein